MRWIQIRFIEPHRATRRRTRVSRVETSITLHLESEPVTHRSNRRGRPNPPIATRARVRSTPPSLSPARLDATNSSARVCLSPRLARDSRATPARRHHRIPSRGTNERPARASTPRPTTIGSRARTGRRCERRRRVGRTSRAIPTARTGTVVEGVGTMTPTGRRANARAAAG